nr:heme exporter protein CcmD [Ketogulonicigenium vulgare]
MMPDLGRYAVAVLSAYGVSLALLIGITWLSIAQHIKARRTLRDIEGKDEN